MNEPGEPVPLGDVVCRFVLPLHWNPGERSVDANAFRASKRRLSLYHVGEVQRLGDQLRSLCIGAMTDAGEAVLEAGAFTRLGQAIEAENFIAPVVVWRPEEVPEPWLRWQHAHANAEAAGGNPQFPLAYRVLLALNCTVVRAPVE